MVISDEQLEAFMQLYEKRYGKRIEKEYAYEQAMKLLVMLKAIYKPMTQYSFEAIQKHRVETLPAILAQLALQERNDIA